MIAYTTPPHVDMPSTSDPMRKAARRCWDQPSEADAKAVPPALYSINVHDRRTGTLLGRYGLATGDLARDRKVALRAALLDVGGSWDWDADAERHDGRPIGPPSIHELECSEEWR